MEYKEQPSYPPDYYQAPPQQSQNTVVVIQQPTGPSVPGGGYQQNVQQWTTGLCGCFENCGICALAFLCPCIHACCLASKMNEFVCGPYFCGGLFVVAMRTKVRHMYGIRGDILCDCCALTWCTYCAMAQMDRELKNRGYF